MLNTRSSIAVLAMVAISTVVGNVIYAKHLKRMEAKADRMYAKATLN